MRRLAAAGLLALVAGCAATDPSPVPAVHVVADPVTLSIPALDVASPPLIPLGLDEAGALEVPPVAQPMVGGWFEPGPEPGQQGPAVIAAHVNGAGQPGLFARLGDLAPGDEVLVDRADGSQAVFSVTRVEQHPKDTFPTAAVYGDTPSPELRLITCSGPWIGGDLGYADNTIVYARLVS